MKEIGGLSEFKNLLVAGGLPELGPGPRDGVLPFMELNETLNALLDQPAVPAGAAEVVRGLILLWHDHLDEAHLVVQAIENADGSFIHGLLHRREPDFPNACYWFRRVGQHAAYPKLAARVTALLNTPAGLKLHSKLIVNGKWDALAFVKLCEQVAGKPEADLEAQLTRKIQGLETEVLLEHFLSS